ncbi:hypothetical protein AGMMS49992_07440 [Clostridia bacterium]|nr:hypothetical protein AGMMS49992_07440 [Clostridia bacterium]
MTQTNQTRLMKELRATTTELRCLTERAARQRLLSQTITRALDIPMTKGRKHNTSRIENAIELIDRYENEINERITLLIDYKKQMESALDEQLEPHKSEIMKLRYVECLGWKDIEKVVNYSISNIYAINKECIDKLCIGKP